MADVFSKEKRSQIMSLIRGTNTVPEMIVRRFLHMKGIRYRLHSKNLAGRPDLTLKKYNTVIFVHGCFWHGHSCKTLPKSNKKFWKDKIVRNMDRDKTNRTELKKQGWRVIEVWQCSLKPKEREKTLNRLLSKIQSN